MDSYSAEGPGNMAFLSFGRLLPLLAGLEGAAKWVLSVVQLESGTS